VLKIASLDILHKGDIGGVKRDARDEQACSCCQCGPRTCGRCWTS
jgi:hypothetical protein